jgi:hypothetical protein
MFPSLARKHGNNHPAVTNDESQLLLTQHEQPTCPSPNQTTTHNPPVTTITDHLSLPKLQNKMSPPIKGPGEARTYDGTPLRIGIVHARWNEKIIAALLEGSRLFRTPLRRAAHVPRFTDSTRRGRVGQWSHWRRGGFVREYE